ncbi:MAG: hypothetical protein M3032_05095 [Verrucomicrobiota bacterium]|nr:hypothetical protein [Verrucomicrobiota bacterium]
MKFRVLLAVLLLANHAHAARLPSPADEFRQLKEATPLKTALDPAFEFRKTKLFLLGSPIGTKVHTGFQGAAKDPAVGFEGSYRLWGAVTELDKRARYGHYFDFWWRAKRDAALTVRLEYRQEALRAFTQAREVDYPHARGNHRTAFAVIGDDFLNDGHILAWRCVLIEKGRIVAETRSYLWR